MPTSPWPPAFPSSTYSLARSLTGLQTQSKTSGISLRGPFHAISTLWQLGGPQAIYRGYLPSLLRETHGLGVYFLSYEAVVNWRMASAKIERSQVSSGWLCLGGACAGYGMWLSAYPIGKADSVSRVNRIRTLTHPRPSTQTSSSHVYRPIHYATPTLPLPPSTQNTPPTSHP